MVFLKKNWFGDQRFLNLICQEMMEKLLKRD
jgi:hypothetical protein